MEKKKKQAVDRYTNKKTRGQTQISETIKHVITIALKSSCATIWS